MEFKENKFSQIGSELECYDADVKSDSNLQGFEITDVQKSPKSN